MYEGVGVSIDQLYYIAKMIYGSYHIMRLGENMLLSKMFEGVYTSVLG